MRILGSDGFFLLIKDLKGVKGAYIFVGSADPKVFAKARAEGKQFPFAAHEPNYSLDLAAIRWGVRLASVLALDVLGKHKHGRQAAAGL